MPRYLTKSRFKIGLECVTKLYYTGKKNEYADQKLDDKFLLALAEGGYQTGVLSLFEFSEKPVGDDIVVETLDYEDSLRITNEKMAAKNTVIAEAAFRYNNLFIRADIIVKNNNIINLYEVKAKSFNSKEENENSFIAGKGEKERVASEWVEYLYDVAFQKYVISKAYPNNIVRSHLVLVDKSKKSTVHGLNQKFKISKNGDRVHIDISGVSKEELGDSILVSIPTDEIVNKIWNKYKVPTTLEETFSFEEFVKFCEEKYTVDERVFSPLTMGCKNCTFKKKPGKDDNLKDGRLECWKHITNYTDDLLQKPWTIDVWQGRMDKALTNGKYLMQQLNVEDLGNGEPRSEMGLDLHNRRFLQVEKVKNNDASYYFNQAGFEEEMSTWKWPYNHIDFETSMVALPFYKGKSPYSGIAFQWSHHIMHENGKIEHAGQYINFEKGVFPNLEFIRTLKASLSRNSGTIFRYHNHENSYLRLIHEQISSDEIEVEEKEKRELLDFINNITRFKADDKNYTCGDRNMVDLYEVVKNYYYSPYSQGKIGLKFILPSIIHDSTFLKEKYGTKGIYGKGLEITSLNFEDHQWIDNSFNNDPYKTLPEIFEGFDREKLDESFDGLDGIADGGAAMSAYSYLQFTHIPEDIRIKLRDALLRYCELDTMAMCFLIEGMKKLKNNTK